MKLLASQIRILETILFEESFENICEDVEFPANIIADDLKWLVAHDLVQVMIYDESTKSYKSNKFLNSDNLSEHFFRISAKGMAYI